MKIDFFLFSLLIASAPLGMAQKTASEPSRENKATIQSALADFDAKKYDAALAKLQVAQQKLPDDPFILNLLGAAYTKKKDYPKAQGYFDKALSLEPNYFPAQFNFGELIFLQRRYAEALEHFKKMQLAAPRNELLQFKIFLCELQLGDKDAAEKSMKSMKYPGDSPAWYYVQAAWESYNHNNKKALEYLTGAKFIFGPKTALFDETFEDLDIHLR